MTEKDLFLFCGLWLAMAIIFGLACRDFFLFLWLGSIPLGILAGWAIVTLIEGGKHGKSQK